MRRAVIVIHRYLGIPLSLVFVVWFVSGIVMMYTRDMPRLTPEARLQRLEPLDLERVRVGAADAAQRAGAATSSVTLLSVMGRPAYRFDGDFFGAVTVFADDGAVLESLDAEAARGVASRFTGAPGSAIEHAGLVTEPDQWTITQAGRLPLHKLRVRDAAATEVYVSPQLAEVTLVTTRASRALAWIGAIPHWFYFTPLRVNQPAWYWTVVWVSAAGCVLALLGLVLAFTQFRRTQPFKLSASIPYRGWMRWHYISGAVFGVFALTWVFSGMMSVEPFAWTRAAGLDVPRDALAGGGLELERFPALDAAAWRLLLDGRELKELELVRVQGDPYYAARGAGTNGELLVAADSMKPREAPFTTPALLARLQQAVPDAAIAEHAFLESYDAYYYARDGAAPLPVLRVKFDDPAQTWVYVDPHRGELVALTHRSSRLERWLFNGLHSLDFAFWYDKRPLWDIGMILLSLGALATSGIGIYLGCRRLQRDFSRLTRRPARPAHGGESGAERTEP